MTPERFLAENWIFTRAELGEGLHIHQARCRATLDSTLARWRRLGRIQRVKEGVYLRRDGPDDAPRDFYALCAKLAPDAVLAYHTALEVHGLAQSVFERLTFATWTKTGRVHFAGRAFEPVRPRKPLQGAPNQDAWVEVLERAGVAVRVTSLERTVVDVLDRPGLAGGPDEVWRSCRHVTALDLRALEEYVVLLGRPGLTARVGWFLETRTEDLAVPLKLLDRLRGRIPRSPVAVDRAPLSRLVSGWNLRVPESWALPSKDREA